MKKIGLSLLAIASVFTMTISSSQVEATDFSKNESKYIKLCSSSSLTNANKATCEEFNEYLSKKNSDLKSQISETKKDLSETNDNIDDVTSKISVLNTEITSRQTEIDYLLSSIKTVEKNIEKKEKLMQDRLYTMQTSYNSNQLLDFLFGAEDFSDFFSRLNNINDITSYEKELVEELSKQKESLDSQKATLLDAQAALQAQKNAQIALQDKLLSLKAEQQASIKENQAEAKKVTDAQKKIDDALANLMKDAPSGGGGSYVAGSSETGNAIAQKALTKLGKRYWWGANGPDYFDCSGLVYWAHKNAGVGLGRLTAAGYAGSGKSITKAQLQPGDVITFSYGSGVAHIGIYIGGGSFVHAAGDGSGTVGQYPNQCVKTATLAGYWESHVYNYRRLY